MNNLRGLFRNVVIIVALSLFSKILGFIREALIASKFGSGSETDIYFIAITASLIIMRIAGTSLSTTLVPVYASIPAEKRNQYTNTILIIVAAVSFFFAGLMYYNADSIVGILAVGFSDVQKVQAVYLSKIGFIMILFTGSIYIFTGYLQNQEKFFATSLTGLSYNGVCIIFLIFLSSAYGLEGLIWATVLAVASQCLIQYPFMKLSGFKFAFEMKMDKSIRKTGLLTLPILFSSTAQQINLIVDRSIASQLRSGSISALNYSSRLMELVVSIFVASVMTAIYPRIAASVVEGESEHINSYIMNVMIILTLPLTVGSILLSEEIVGLAFQRGQFTRADTLMTASAFACYSVGYLGIATTDFLNKILYAKNNSRIPMYFGVAAVVLNILLIYPLKKYYGHAGIALATSISVLASGMLLFIYTVKVHRLFNVVKVLICFAKASVGTAAMGAFLWLAVNASNLKNGSQSNLRLLIMNVIIGAVLYNIVGLALRIQEVVDINKQIAGMIKLRLRK